jgi:Ni,Fe-hydrogenase maturation factor
MDVELCETGTNGLALLDILHCQDLLIVVDACVGSGPPGFIGITDMDSCETLSRGASIHQIGPVESLLIGRYLYPELMPQRSLLITVDTNGLEKDREDVACDQAIKVLDREIGAWRAAKAQPGKEKKHGKY